MDVQEGEGRPHDEALAENRASFVAALAGGDAKTAAAVYAGNARLLAPSAAVFHGREATERFWRAGLESGVVEVDQERLERDPHDGLAYEYGRYARGLAADDGAAVLDREAYLLVHERQPDGSWRRAVETINPDAPPAPVGAPSKEETR